MSLEEFVVSFHLDDWPGVAVFFCHRVARAVFCLSSATICPEVVLKYTSSIGRVSWNSPYYVLPEYQYLLKVPETDVSWAGEGGLRVFPEGAAAGPSLVGMPWAPVEGGKQGAVPLPAREFSQESETFLIFFAHPPGWDRSYVVLLGQRRVKWLVVGGNRYCWAGNGWAGHIHWVA